MDFVCAKQFHSNVNKVSPNRTILAGEKVGITWLLLNEPGVYWSGVFLFLLLFFCVVFFPLKCISQVFCGYDCCRFEHAYNCFSCYVKPSFIKTTLLWRASSQPYTDCWSQLLPPWTDPEKSVRFCTDVQTYLCASDCRIRALIITREQLCCCPLKPGLSGMTYRQQSSSKVGFFQLPYCFSFPFSVNVNVC